MHRHHVRLAAAMGLALFGCGGGGSELVGDAVPPWEVGAGVCAFDDERAYRIAMDMGATCRVVMWGNTSDDEKWPSASWPSTERVSR